jgi:hypothetical protein
MLLFLKQQFSNGTQRNHVLNGYIHHLAEVAIIYQSQ